jgi:hypothetical protein
MGPRDLGNDVAGPYLNPPGNAAVSCADGTSPCQALERAQPVLPLRPGIPDRQTRSAGAYARDVVVSGAGMRPASISNWLRSAG